MTRCAACGKRFWGDLVWIPDKGSYHYECAKRMGLLMSLEATKDAITKTVEEISSETCVVEKLRAEGASRREARERLQRLSNSVKYLNSLQTILVRRRQESLDEKKGV